MDNLTSIFKFVTIRNGAYETPPDAETNIQPETDFVTSLITINEGTGTSAEKYEDMNAALQDFLDSAAFVKTKERFDALKLVQDAAPSDAYVEDLYNNIVARIMTKSNTTRIFQLLITQLKYIYSIVHTEAVSDLSIVLPERLILSFTGFSAPAPDGGDDDDEAADISETVGMAQQYGVLQELIAAAKDDQVISFETDGKVIQRNQKFAVLNDVLGKDKVTLSAAKDAVYSKVTELTNKFGKAREFSLETNEEKTVETSASAALKNNVDHITTHLKRWSELRDLVDEAAASGITDINRNEKVLIDRYSKLMDVLKPGVSLKIADAEKAVSKKLAELARTMMGFIKPVKYTLIADKWVDTTSIADAPETVTVDDQSIVVYSHGCYLKFPFFVADLRVIEQLTVGYLPGEIAHINNTQPGEMHEKETRRLTRVESVDTVISEDEVYHETDTQSAEKFSLEKEAADLQASESSWNVNASVSATYGPVSASVDAGYSGSDSSVSSNTSSQQYAKEIIQRVVDRVSSRIKRERTTKTLEEFEEKVKHVIDNSGQGTKSFVYRWLNKLTRGTLKNYGKRLMFQIDIAHPSHYYLSRALQERPTLDIAPDPRTITLDGQKMFTVDNITRENYLAIGELYNVKLEQPPVQKIIVSETLNGSSSSFTSKLIPIKDNYQCKKAYVSDHYNNGYPYGNQFCAIVGNSGWGYWALDPDDLWVPREIWLKNETGQLPVSILQGNQGFIFNIEIECELTNEALQAWKIKTYYAIVEAYEQLKSDAESKMNEWSPDMVGINPTKKTELIRTELKKEAIRRMFRCNPFWVDDKYVIGNEYDPNCCRDNANAERVRFLETVFDWQNMTYQFHPYFYADKQNWAKQLNLTDDDPHFEAFMQASYATIRIPVFRDSLKETAAVNFVMTNAIANYETVPENLQTLLTGLDTEVATLFTYDLDGNEIAEPKETVDLGIFPLPTNLVILECGNTDGIKPIGFPQSTDAPTSDVIIPKQYSPAIIADSCSAPADPSI